MKNLAFLLLLCVAVVACGPSPEERAIKHDMCLENVETYIQYVNKVVALVHEKHLNAVAALNACLERGMISHGNCYDETQTWINSYADFEALPKFGDVRLAVEAKSCYLLP